MKQYVWIDLANTTGLSAISATLEIEYTWTGYFMTEQAARDILEGWTSDRVAKVAYKTALDELCAERQVFKGSMEAQIAKIRESHAGRSDGSGRGGLYGHARRGWVFSLELGMLLTAVCRALSGLEWSGRCFELDKR